MDSKSVKEAISKIKSEAKKRKFTQTYDYILNLKDIDIKKQEGQIDIFATLPNPIGKETKICALVGPELYDDAKAAFEKVVHVDDFSKLEKKEIKKLSEEYDFFVAQANIMAKVAQFFGRILGPKGKMPNPKAGCVVPPKTNLPAVIEKLNKTIRINTKKEAIIKVRVGKDDLSDEELEQNIMSAYDYIIHHLPLEANNIKTMYLKLTMGKPVQLN